MSALIELVCRAHPIAEGPGPLITLIDGVWAYCEGGALRAHRWTRIDPTRREHIGDLSQIQARQAS
jgi:hypothetical protein